MNAQELKKQALRMAEERKNESVVKADAEIIAWLLDNADIVIPEGSRLRIMVDTGDAMHHVPAMRAAEFKKELMNEERSAAAEIYAYNGDYDFGHTAPGWDAVIRLGLKGLRDRVLQYRDQAQNPAFVPAEMLVFDAAFRFLKRAEACASAQGKTDMAAGLAALGERAPENLYEAMLLYTVFYALMHFAEGTNVRSLGRLDRVLTPFYEKEADKKKAAALFDEFMTALDEYRVPANIPFMIGGSDTAGNDLVNETSYEILRSYIRVKPAFVKLHILCTEKTPEDFILLMMDGIKAGANSLVFMNDEIVIRSLEKLGEKHEDAADYAVVGCYECGGREETACTCNGRINLQKALEFALHHGKDALTGAKIGVDTDGIYPTYEDLYQGYLKQLSHMLSELRAIIDGYESHYDMLHASPFFSATYERCVKKGGDIYADGTTPYPNSSISAVGLATVTDSLAAIRKLVYEDRTMTLDELVQVLDDNWQTQPVLRGLIEKKYPKFGNADPETDAIAAGIVRALSERVNNVPNAKGGVYRLGLFSIDDRIKLGGQTAASADGRFDRETLSQNTGAAFGADREGVTAHLLSVTAIDATDVADGAVVDIDLHESAVHGEKGNRVLAATLKTYLERGGFAVHYNVLDTEVLKDAKAHPEKYPNLQVRLCGWNVRFIELSEYAQDEFIRRSEHQAG